MELGAGPEVKGGAGAFVVLGVLAACVAGTAGVVLADNTIKQRSVDLQEAVQKQSALQQCMSSLFHCSREPTLIHFSPLASRRL